MSDGPAAMLPRLVASRLLLASGGSASARAIDLLEPIVDGPLELLLDREALLGKAYWDAGDLVNSRAAYERGRRLDAGLPSAAGAGLAAGEAAFVMNVDGDVLRASRILGQAIAVGRGTPRVVATHETIRAFIDGIDTFDAVRAAYEALLSDLDEPGAAFGTAHNVGDLATLGRGHDAAHAFLVTAVNDFDVRDMAGRADDLRGERIQAAAMLAGGEGGSGGAKRPVAVRNEADAGAVVLAALQGAAVTVDSATDPALVERIRERSAASWARRRAET